MTKTLTISETELENKKNNLVSAQRQVSAHLGNEFKSWIRAGYWFGVIEREELYRENKYTDFRTFFQNEYGWTGMDFKQVQKRISLSDIYQAIEHRIAECSDVTEPTSGKQLEPLLKWSNEPSKAADVWVQMTEDAKKSAVPKITGEFVQDFLSRRPVIDIVAHPVTPVQGTHDPSTKEASDAEDITFSSAPSPVRPAEAVTTLNRISNFAKEDLLDESLRKSIEDQIIAISNDELSRWNAYEDIEFIRIGRLVFSGMPYTSAYRFLKRVEEPISDKNSLLEMVYKGIALERSVVVDFLGYRVSAVKIAK